MELRSSVSRILARTWADPSRPPTSWPCVENPWRNTREMQKSDINNTRPQIRTSFPVSTIVLICPFRSCFFSYRRARDRPFPIRNAQNAKYSPKMACGSRVMREKAAEWKSQIRIEFPRNCLCHVEGGIFPPLPGCRWSGRLKTWALDARNRKMLHVSVGGADFLDPDAIRR